MDDWMIWNDLQDDHGYRHLKQYDLLTFLMVIWPQKCWHQSSMRFLSYNLTYIYIHRYTSLYIYIIYIYTYAAYSQNWLIEVKWLVGPPSPSPAFCWDPVAPGPNFSRCRQGTRTWQRPLRSAAWGCCIRPWPGGLQWSTALRKISTNRIMW